MHDNRILFTGTSQIASRVVQDQTTGGENTDERRNENNIGVWRGCDG